MPREVLFGIDISEKGEVYFSMNNTEWFDKLFRNENYGVSVDLISKDQYSCVNPVSNIGTSLPKGILLPTVYKQALIKGKDVLKKGYVWVKIGDVPAGLTGKQLEGNLVLFNGNYICHYTNFVNIDRNVWSLLPMGLFTDSLIQAPAESEEDNFFFFTKKLQLEIPFQKSSSSFNSKLVDRFFDSLNLSRFNIQKIEIRAYSSVEGPEKINEVLMKQRADTSLQAVKKYEPAISRIEVHSSENWLEFFDAIRETEFSEMEELSKSEIKEKLTDKAVIGKLEPILSSERKAVVVLYLKSKSSESAIDDNAIFSEFKLAVQMRDLAKARALQQELVNRINDNKLPVEYINRLEVPRTAEFSNLLNDREVYRYMLEATTEYEALENFNALRKLDPANGHISYNTCALRFFLLQHGSDKISYGELHSDINSLRNKEIDISLIKRMLINYYILKCDVNMQSFNYAGKDSAINLIRGTYDSLDLNDADIFSVAKFYSYYSHQEWAMDIVQDRTDKIDADENLVFYHLNLLFFYPASYKTDEFRKATLNAINLNRSRYCRFFDPNDKGGASMQLLNSEIIRSTYCEVCK